MTMIKPVMTYIGKALKATVVLTAAFALIGGSLIFCCLTMTAEASMQAAQSSDHCHPAKTSPSKVDHSKTCDCCKIRSSDSDTLVKLLEIVPSFAKSFHAFVTADVLAYWPEVRLSHLTYTGPPRANSSLPIYLQFSCLRL